MDTPATLDSDHSYTPRQYFIRPSEQTQSEGQRCEDSRAPIKVTVQQNRLDYDAIDAVS